MNTAAVGNLRVVLDTNVYISAFTHPQGQPFQIWRAALHRHYTLVISPTIVNELAVVLRVRFVWENSRVINRMKLITKVAEIVVPTISLNEIESDETDNRILECAFEGKADLIVSGDQHLRRLKTFRGIGIVRPADFHRTLGL